MGSLYRCSITVHCRCKISGITTHAGKITDQRDLLNELSTVSKWYLLGIYLGLCSSKLDEFSADYKTTEACRTQMLIEWQKRVVPTWSAVVKALVGIRECQLARHLAVKYGNHLELHLWREN